MKAKQTTDKQEKIFQSLWSLVCCFQTKLNRKQNKIITNIYKSIQSSFFSISLPLNVQWLMCRPKLSSHHIHVWLRDVVASFLLRKISFVCLQLRMYVVYYTVSYFFIIIRLRKCTEQQKKNWEETKKRKCLFKTKEPYYPKIMLLLVSITQKRKKLKLYNQMQNEQQKHVLFFSFFSF